MKKINTVLHSFFLAIQEEMRESPVFSTKIEMLLSTVLIQKKKKHDTEKTSSEEKVPDVYTEFEKYGKNVDDFRSWLRGLDIKQLQAIAKKNDFAKISQGKFCKEKLVELIVKRVTYKRGLAFLSPVSVVPTNTEDAQKLNQKENNNKTV